LVKTGVSQDFKLTENFIEKYKTKKPPFGFNGLGEFVYMRTYSIINEAWWETIRRVVEGIYNIQKEHIDRGNLGWNAMKAQKSAQEMYDLIFNIKFLPSGRALWALGSKLINEKRLVESLYNCSFISTEDIKNDPALPFEYGMDMLMCGVGLGFDTRGAGSIVIKEQSPNTENYIIPDSREGWVESVKKVIMSFFGNPTPILDYSEIRPEGSPIKTFGGTSSGYKPLKKLHDQISETLNKKSGKKITQRDIVDLFNFIAQAVVAGNVRRSAEIALGNNDEEFLNLKNYKVNPERELFGWASNNSVIAEIGMDYKNIADRIRENAEPGLNWIENFRRYGRMRESENNGIDFRIMGANPCMEIGLESAELCNLSEVFPYRHNTKDEFLRTLKYAYLFAKSVTLIETRWVETNRVMLRNRRLGVSVTGVAQFIADRGVNELKDWLKTGYDIVKNYDSIYSDWFAIPKSIKLTTVKPSGTLSLLGGSTPGVHYPESNYYIRRVRLGNLSPLIEVLKKSGYLVEPAFGQEDSTSVVEFPVFVGDKVRTQEDVSMWEQLAQASFMQKYWSDNAVSVTVTFDPEREGRDIERALDFYQYQLKGVSFLPRIDGGTYPQMPYEKITKEKYEEMIAVLSPIDFSSMTEASTAEIEKYCSNDTCLI
jgi:ribonucleoside-triphosphate reductase